VSFLATATAAAYEYRAGSELPLYALKRRKAQKQRGFRAKSTYGHCIKDEVLIDPCCGSGHILAYLFDVLVQIYEDYGCVKSFV
jgi:type II restriction/modification system DNA methylase subunit YeeA